MYGERRLRRSVDISNEIAFVERLGAIQSTQKILRRECEASPALLHAEFQRDALSTLTRMTALCREQEVIFWFSFCEIRT
jgi:hypothetical protein